MTIRQHPFLATILTASLVLAACGDDGSDDTTEAAGDDSTETTAEPEDTDAPEAEDTADAEAEVGDTVATVFDSSVPFDDKITLLEGGEAHRADHDAYVTAADAVGGITVEATDVAIEGDAATVTYAVLFGGTEAYADLTMDVTQVDGAWVVPTDAFCGFLASARTPCAEEAG
jgi:iron complex transport system substrate-binding protein